MSLGLIGVIAVSCEKEVFESYTSSQSANTGFRSSAANLFGDASIEDDVYNLASSTDSYFEGEEPTVGEWINKFLADYSPTIIVPEGTTNQDEFDYVVTTFQYEFFSPDYTPSSNSFRDRWLLIIADNSTLTENEKHLISNMVYITNAFGKVVLNNNFSGVAHGWEDRFDDCMGRAVPSTGPFRAFAWAISGEIFLDLGDCIGTASRWWNVAQY